MTDRGPAVKAVLIKTVTSDGIYEVNDDVPLGKVYTVYPDTICEMEYGHYDHPGVTVRRQSIWVDGDNGREGGWMATEILKIETPN